jgi:YesN/AraC family two-component response regulator
MSCSVIVAEDEVLLLENIVKKINRYSPDFKVVGSAQTGIEAYALIEELCPDILITDIRMPAMDGLELIKKVHENPGKSLFF